MRRYSKLILVAVVALFASPVFAQVSVPEIPFDSTPNLLKMPDNIVIGEAVGVATNSKGHIYVYTRDGSLSYTVGTSRQFARAPPRGCMNSTRTETLCTSTPKELTPRPSLTRCVSIPKTISGWWMKVPT